MRKLLMSFCTSWNFSPQSFVYPIISFVCLIISPQSFVWQLQCKGNYTVGTKGLCSTDFFNEVSLIFVHMVSTGKFLLQLLQTKVALFTAFHCIHRIPSISSLVLIFQKMSKCKYTLKSAS